MNRTEILTIRLLIVLCEAEARNGHSGSLRLRSQIDGMTESTPPEDRDNAYYEVGYSEGVNIASLLLVSRLKELLSAAEADLDER